MTNGNPIFGRSKSRFRLSSRIHLLPLHIHRQWEMASKDSRCQSSICFMLLIIACVPSSGVRPEGPWTRMVSNRRTMPGRGANKKYHGNGLRAGG